MTEAPSQRTISSDSFPQAGKFYTLVGKEIDWTLADGENTTMPFDIMLRSSVQDVVDNVAIVNRSTGWVSMSPENMVGTVDASYEIDLNRTILWGHRNRMIFTPAGFQGLDDWPLDMDVGEHTWVWYPTDLYIGAEVLVGWTFDSEFLGDTLYEVVRDEVIQVVGEKQDCWVLRFPPSIGLDGWVWAETLRVDKETGVPLKVNGEGRALDGSSGLEYELVLTRTNIDLGTESTQPPSPTYTLTVPTSPGFPETGKFWSWYVLEKGWNMRDASNVSYYEEGLLTRWVANVTNDEALVYKIYWGDYLCDAEDVEELEAVGILYTIYRVNTTTREIIEAISSLIYHINMTSLTYEIIDRTALLADDVGEETYCWLPTDINIGAKVNITWSYDRSWTLDNATYTVIDEKILSALEKPQACWVLYLPPTASIDGTWNYSDTLDSDKDTGIPLCSFTKGWAVDDSSAWVDNCWLMDTNVDLTPPFPQPGMFYTLAGRTVGWEVIGGENVTTGHHGEIDKWSIQDLVSDVVFVNRTFVDSYIRPQTGENYTETYDFDYQIATNRTILSMHVNDMVFTTAGFVWSGGGWHDWDIGEHTGAWFPTDLYVGAYVPVGWLTDRNFLDDMLYEVVDEEVIQVIGEKQDCWMLRMPPSVTVDGLRARTETYWVDKDTGIPLKLHFKEWALDGSSGWDGEDVLVHTNIDLGPESTQPSSPTYTLTVPTTSGFPEAGKFYTWYYLEEGWYMSDATNVTWYAEALFSWWVVNVTEDEALVYRIMWYDRVCEAEGVEELEAVEILYFSYRIGKTNREILEATGSYYFVNMTSLTCVGPEDLTPPLAGDIGEETYCWLPTNLYLGAAVNITWTFDRAWKLDNATYTVIDEEIISVLGQPQACWVLHLPPTSSIDGTWNYSETYYSDKDVGIPLGVVSKGWAVDGRSAYRDAFQFIGTNVDLGPSTYYLAITSTAGGTTSPLPGTYNYTEGSSHNVTAISNSGYSFDYWLLDGEEERTENPITIIMNANHTLEAVYFAVDITPPNITNVIQNPPKNNVLPEDEVKINATVTDASSVVKRVTLIYSYANSSGTWLKVVDMTNLEGNVWNATIPAFPYCTNVTYTIMAEDKAGNTITTLEMGFEYQYPVIPEFPTAIILPPIMIASLLAVVLYKKRKATFTMKHSTKPTCLTSDSA